MKMTASPSMIKRNLMLALLALVLVMTIGTLGYRVLGGEKYSWLDCFYMTFVTISTIGYHEVVDVSQYQYGRLFTVFIGMSGIGVLGYVLSTFTALMLENDLDFSWRRKRMLQSISKLNGHFIVCGVGRVGSSVAEELVLTGRQCVVIDTEQHSIDSFLEKYPTQLYLHGDATDNDVLVAAGIMRARGVFAVATDDNKNLVISLSAKQLNPELRVVARCHDLKNVEKTRKAGADDIVSPDYTGGLRMASAMLRPEVVSFLDEMLHTDSNMRIEELRVSSSLSGKALSEMNMSSRHYMVLAIRQDRQWMFNPDAQVVMQEGDVLMLMTTPHGRDRLERMMLGVA